MSVGKYNTYSFSYIRPELYILQKYQISKLAKVIMKVVCIGK